MPRGMYLILHPGRPTTVALRWAGRRWRWRHNRSNYNPDDNRNTWSLPWILQGWAMSALHQNTWRPNSINQMRMSIDENPTPRMRFSSCSAAGPNILAMWCDAGELQRFPHRNNFNSSSYQMRMKDNMMMKFDVNERQSGWFVQNHCWGFPGPCVLPRRHQKHTLHQHYRNEHGEWFIPLIKTAHIQQETSDWHTMVFLHAWNDLLTSLAVNIWLMLELMLSLPDLSALQRSNTAEDQHNNWSEKTLWWRGLVQDRLQPEVILVIICDRRSKDDLNLLDLRKAYQALSKLTLSQLQSQLMIMICGYNNDNDWIMWS